MSDTTPVRPNLPEGWAWVEEKQAEAWSEDAMVQWPPFGEMTRHGAGDVPDSVFAAVRGAHWNARGTA